MKAQDDKNPFASKFQDFGAVPSNAVWKGIEAALPEKKKKRIFAWWWWTTGMAACLLLVGILLFEKNPQGIPGKRRSGSSVSIVKHSNRKQPDFINNGSNTKANRSGDFQIGITKENGKPILNEREIVNALVKTPKVIAWQNDEKNQKQNENEKQVGNETFNDVTERAVILLPRGIDLLLEHSIPERHSRFDTTTRDRTEMSWWVGATVEQSNRFAVKSDVISEPPAYYSSADGITGFPYYWDRIQSLQLTGGFDWRKWSVGSGLEYSKLDRRKETENGFHSLGQSFGIPVFATYRFYSNRFFSLGAQLDLRPRYVSYLADSMMSAEVTSSPSNSPQSFTSTEFKGVQTQLGFGLCIDVPVYRRFSWNTVVEYQHSGYRSNDLQYILNGSWLGVKTGIFMHF